MAEPVAFEGRSLREGVRAAQALLPEKRRFEKFASEKSLRHFEALISRGDA